MPPWCRRYCSGHVGAALWRRCREPSRQTGRPDSRWKSGAGAAAIARGCRRPGAEAQLRDTRVWRRRRPLVVEAAFPSRSCYATEFFASVVPEPLRFTTFFPTSESHRRVTWERVFFTGFVSFRVPFVPSPSGTLVRSAPALAAGPRGWFLAFRRSVRALPPARAWRFLRRSTAPRSGRCAWRCWRARGPHTA